MDKLRSRTLIYTPIKTTPYMAKRSRRYKEIFIPEYSKLLGDTPGGNRTPDAFLRTEALYPLSYGGMGRERRA